MPKKRKRKKKTDSKKAWLLSVILSCVFYVVLIHFVAFPEKMKLPFLFGIVVLNLLIGAFSVFSKRQGLMKFLCILLSVLFAAGSLYVPSLENKLKNIFQKDPLNVISEKEPSTYTIYAFTKEYKEAHPDILEASVIKGQYTHIYHYAGASFLIQNASDFEEQMYVLSQVCIVYKTVDLWTITKTSLKDQLDAFYSGEGELLVINDERIEDIEKMPGYEHFRSDTCAVYTVSDQDLLKNRAPVSEKDILTEPFTVLITGNDTRSLNLTQYGRTDVNILAVVDPVNYQVIILSLPRDAFIWNPKLKGNDKLTHLGVTGLKNTMAGLSSYFDIPVDYYMTVNFRTFEIIVDALDGIDIDNPYAFSASEDAGVKAYFEKGKIHLSGPEALAYVRERKNLINGDFGRNEHQVIALKAIIEKVTSPVVLTKIDSLLSALEGQFLTSIDPAAIYKLAGSTLDHDGGWKIIQYHLDGIDDYQKTISMPDTEVYVAHFVKSQTTLVIDEMKKVLNSEIVDQEQMPPFEKIAFDPDEYKRENEYNEEGSEAPEE